MESNERDFSDPTPVAHDSIRVGKLDSISDIRTELARLYRTARRTAGAEVEAATATKLAFLLQCISRSLEGAEMETRISMLEKKLVEINEGK
jgi:hypothetical protein